MLAAGGATGLSLALGGCASVPPSMPGAAAPLCLPRVKVSPNRVIRTVAGLRPYRRTGFVVREQRLGATRVIHNYGHGGGGITLSWGSSRLAVDLGLPGHSGPVAVIGAGALGLTTAKLLQEAGLAVRIYAESLPPHTTSNVAGGQINPTSVFSRSAVDDGFMRQFEAAMDYSFRRFQISVGEDTGVRWHTTYDAFRERPLSDLERRIMPDARVLGEGEHPFPVPMVREWRTMYVETGRWLAHLLRDIRIAGGTIERRGFGSPAEIAALPETLVFNCTGLGARDLFGDTGMVPIRGQLAILLPQPEIRHAYTGPAGYMFPRPDGILLGGTYERGAWDPTPQPDDIAVIIAAHAEFNREMTCTA
ncbi:FAD-binding oxidoreductase [Alteriqipengyuania lutimaris]|uniref:D-amino-acid oxidase n=1 Tax=Alteriqipengyuania lutimaris TaxID=1538146 RepID=A0A395LNE8_9SPHN|nr:FAD-binding oxidoreductase [Alteriqipengyuania lutimaris]